jgi:hypothetical protein
MCAHVSCSVLWRQENSKQQEISSHREELSRKEQALRSMTGKVLISYVEYLFALAFFNVCVLC